MSSVPTARVVAITKPLVEEAGTAGDFIAYAARISNPGNQANKETAPRLLAYLKHHKHWSPFEMAHATLKVVTTRDIARQLLRHRTLAFQEFSLRYAEPDFVPESRPARRQDDKNRQNSIDDMSAKDRRWWHTVQADLRGFTQEAYVEARRRGIAKEVARAILPEGLTPSTLFVTGSFRSWTHYLEVRLNPSTQLEHRLLAKAIQSALVEHEPMFSEIAA